MILGTEKKRCWEFGKVLDLMENDAAFPRTNCKGDKATNRVCAIDWCARAKREVEKEEVRTQEETKRLMDIFRSREGDIKWIIENDNCWQFAKVHDLMESDATFPGTNCNGNKAKRDCAKDWCARAKIELEKKGQQKQDD